jgi:hypothetical protein
VKCLYSNFSKYDHIIKWCLEDILQLSDYNLNVTFCILSGCLGKFLEPHTIYISQDLDEEQTIRTLFHEIRHYYQYNFLSSVFDFDFGKHLNKWDGSDYYDEDDESFRDTWISDRVRLHYYQDYKNLPWELDATKFSTETHGKYLAIGREDCKKHLWYGNYENYDNLS